MWAMHAAQGDSEVTNDERHGASTSASSAATFAILLSIDPCCLRLQTTSIEAPFQ